MPNLHAMINSNSYKFPILFRFHHKNKVMKFFKIYVHWAKNLGIYYVGICKHLKPFYIYN